jgi:phosphoglycolate phosphatase
MIKNIIFDWSGVIIDSTQAVYLVVNQILKYFNVSELGWDEFRDNWEMPYLNFYKKYIPDLSLEEEKKAYRKVVKEVYSAEIFGDVKDVLTEFKEQGIRMFVVSGDTEITFYKELEKGDLLNIFEKIYLDVHDKFDNVQKIVEENNLQKEKTLIIGDTTHEIQIGNKIGIQTIGITRGFQKKKKLESAQPDYIIDNFNQLKEIVFKEN